MTATEILPILRNLTKGNIFVGRLTHKVGETNKKKWDGVLRKINFATCISGIVFKGLCNTRLFKKRKKNHTF